MISVVGLGSCGCNITQKFSAYPQYKTYYIDTEGQYSGHKVATLPEFSTPEEYEANCPEMSSFFEDIDDDVLFIIGGSGHISGASLRLLSYLQDKNISILYIKPDVEFVSKTKKLIENCTFHILQEFARSGVFKRLYLFENSSLEKIIGDLTITNFYDKINDYLVPIVHMINVFDNTEPVMTSFSSVGNSSRICTLGVVDIKSGEERVFFPLDNVKEKKYYFGVNKETLKSDASLLREIKDYIRTTSQETQSSFSIYETTYDHNFAYVVCFSSQIQTKNN